jgi:hypothetical protein
MKLNKKKTLIEKKIKEEKKRESKALYNSAL